MNKQQFNPCLNCQFTTQLELRGSWNETLFMKSSFLSGSIDKVYCDYQVYLNFKMC